MTLYTSDIDYKNNEKYRNTVIIDSYEIIEEEAKPTGRVNDIRIFQTAVIYMIIAIALAIFGAVYEFFSHGVFSYYMIYAFAIPLLGGAVPYMIDYIHQLRAKTLNRKSGSIFNKLIRTSGLYHAGLATLTIGSIMKGVLDIYGTTNGLTIVYPVVGVLLILLSLIPAGNIHKFNYSKKSS